jgi:hypothetical protein
MPDVVDLSDNRPISRARRSSAIRARHCSATCTQEEAERIMTATGELERHVRADKEVEHA